MQTDAARAWADHFREQIERELEGDDWLELVDHLAALLGEPEPPIPARREPVAA